LVAKTCNNSKSFQKKSKQNQWTEEDQSELVSLMVKYPGGTPERWQKIAKEMGKTVQQVTAKAKTSLEFVGKRLCFDEKVLRLEGLGGFETVFFFAETFR